MFLVDPRGTNPNTHRIFITETNDKKLKVQHDDKDVIVDVTTPPTPRKIKKYLYICTKCDRSYVYRRCINECFTLYSFLKLRIYFQFISQTISHRDTHITIALLALKIPQSKDSSSNTARHNRLLTTQPHSGDAKSGLTTERW